MVARYLVIHDAKDENADEARPPSRLRELAEASMAEGSSPRWITAWSPDLHDDRIFSLWEARDAAEIQAMLAGYGFLDDREALPLRVREWGPAEILAAEE